jgi:hypothetical protein
MTVSRQCFCLKSGVWMTLVEERPPKKEYQPRPADDIVEVQTEPIEEPVEGSSESPAAETDSVNLEISDSRPDLPTELSTEEDSAEQAESLPQEQTETEQPESAPDGPNG